MAVRPVDLQDFSKASTVVRSDSAVVIVLARRYLFCFRGASTVFAGRTSFAGQVENAVDVELTALGSVEGWAEVGRGALEDCGRGECGEGCDGEGGELHFDGLAVLLVLVGSWLEWIVLR